jgi:hypothetical protein
MHPDPSPQDVRDAWAAVPEPDPNVKVLIGGVNLRLNVVKALKSVYLTAKLAIKLKGSTVGLADLPGMAKDAFDLVVAGLDSVRQTLSRPVYLIGVVLSGLEGPVTVDELRARLDAFIVEQAEQSFSWYFGIHAADIRETREILARDPKALEQLLAKLEAEQLATHAGDKWQARPRHFTWSGKLEGG